MVKKKVTKHKAKKPARKSGKVKLTKIDAHEHRLIHMLLQCASSNRLNEFEANIHNLNNGYDLADLLMKQKNLTIFSAFPWNQTGDASIWQNIARNISHSRQYPLSQAV